MKTAIIYYSKHHSNTKKLIDAISAENEITAIDAVSFANCDLSQYDLIGFASGIYYSKFHKSVIKIVENNLPKGKRVFFLYTCGAKKDSYTKAIKIAAEKNSALILGEYGCLGFDSYGPFKLVGGIAKGHPDSSELSEASAFYKNLIS